MPQLLTWQDTLSAASETFNDKVVLTPGDMTTEMQPLREFSWFSHT